VQQIQDSFSVCLIGCGAIGSVHLEAYERNEFVTSITVVDSNDISGVLTPGIKFVTDLCSIEAQMFDLYDICTPTHSHADIVHSILRPGSMILCEKPMDESSKVVKDLLEISDNSDALIQLAFVERFNEAFIELGKFCAEKSDIRSIRLERSTKPSYSEWQKTYDLQGGIVFDLMIHDIDFLTSLFGADAIKVNDVVFSDYENICVQLSAGTCDIEVSVARNLPTDHPTGIRNRIKVEAASGNSFFYDSDEGDFTCSFIDVHKTVRKIQPRYPLAYYAEVDTMVDIARGTALPFISNDEILASSRIVEEVRESF
jgi:predicted dehydrogenase